MYHLRKDPRQEATARTAEGKIGRANERLADSSAGLVFEPEPHRYLLGGKEIRNVSSIVERFAPFDSRAKAEAVSKNPRHPLYGKTPEEIIAVWEDKRDRAAEAGTRIHAFGEACCLWMTGKEDQIDPEFRDRITSEGLAAIDPKETACAMWWASLDWGRLAVVAKETRIVNTELRYAGTFDLLLYDIVDTVYRQKDYKTNEDLYKWHGEWMKPPLNILKSDDIGKYTVQQTLYAIQLGNIGLKVASSDLIWLREESFVEVPIDLGYSKIISYAVANLSN